jgi:Zn-dependent M28 family amino/carboxypeptidase
VTVELARLAARAGTRLPVAFVAFAGEERRYYSGTNRYAWGSRVYLERLEARERAAMRGFLDLDMVGSGYGVLETGSGKIHRWLRAAARRLGIPVGSISTTYLSDHIPFRDVGLPHAWVWAGEHPSLHEPWDRMPVVRRAELRRVGSLAWAALRRARA